MFRGVHPGYFSLLLELRTASVISSAPMPPARPAAAPTLHAEGGADSEFERVLRIGNPGAALRRALTFAPAADLSAAAWLDQWERWQRDVFAAKLAPHLAAVANHALRGGTREIQALDEALDAALTPGQAERSTLAGKRLLGQLAGARGERFLTKLQARAETGTLPAHFATVHATQSALFHLSLRLLLPGYAHWEWTAAMGACPPLGHRPPTFAQVLPSIQPIIQTTFASPFHAVPSLPSAVGEP